MSSYIDDVVRPAHNPQVAVFILVTGVGSLVITGVRLEIRLTISSIVVPQRRKTTRRQRQFNGNVSDLITSYFRAFIIEYTNVVAGNRLATRSGFYWQ